MPAIPYIKTKIGEHDYHQRPCYEFCKIGAEFCPFVNADRKTPGTVTRWSDLADQRLDEFKKEMLSGGKDNNEGNPPMEENGNDPGEGNKTNSPGISIDFSQKQENDYSGSGIDNEQLEKEMQQAGFTCWGDCSGFEYDQMSRNIIGPGGPVEDVYDITKYGIDHNPLELSKWNAWIEKYQYDYRYGRVSDTNAECILFPNVDNPWKFTEYVFRGVGNENEKCALEIPGEYVVEPPLYDPATLRLVNGNLTVEHPNSDFDGKYAATEKYGGSTDRQVRQFRKIENWDALTEFSADELGITEEEALTKYSKWYSQVHKGKESSIVQDAGMRLYCAKIPVQCIKWGEHGNVPPHAIDMTAPQDWLEPEAAVTAIKPVYTAHIGSPLYASYDGVITWGDPKDDVGESIRKYKGRQAYIGEVALSTHYDAYGRKYFEYSVVHEYGQPVAMPEMYKEKQWIMMNPTEKVMGIGGKRNYCHGGCAMCHGEGTSPGQLRCSYLDSIEDGNQPEIHLINSYFNKSCITFGVDHECTHFVSSRQHPLIATYQPDILTLDQISRSTYAFGMGMLLGVAGGLGGLMAGMTIAAEAIGNEIDKVAKYYKNLNMRMAEVEVSYDVHYEVVHADTQRPPLNKIKYNEYGEGVQIQPGVGKFPIDNEADANVFSGGDTNVYDDINTLSFHRFFCSVMHCAKQEHCNEFAGDTQKAGWDPSQKAKGDGKCRYYHEAANDGGPGCPFRCVPKRANEYCNTAANIYKKTHALADQYMNMTAYGCWDIVAGQIYSQTANAYKKTWIEGKQWCIFYNQFAVAQSDDGIAIVAIRLDNGTTTGSLKKITSNVDASGDYEGAALLADPEKLPKGYIKFCEFRTVRHEREIKMQPWWASGSEHQIDESGKIITGQDGKPLDWPTKKIKVYEVQEEFYWFKPLNNDGDRLLGNIYTYGDAYNETLETALKDPSQSSLLYKDNKTPVNLRQHVDKNGYWFCKAEPYYIVPSYNSVIVDNEEKFIGGWHPEYKDYSKIGSEFMQNIVSDASREGQGIGDYFEGHTTGIPQEVNPKGYWIDQSGEYILDERDIGYYSPIAGNDEREGTGGGSPCISFKKSNTEKDPETGKTKQPKVLNGAVFANDPYVLLMVDYKGKNGTEGSSGKGRPEFDDPDKEDAKYLAPCHINQPRMLPTMRMALHCPNCDYYIPIKYHGVEKCPWCGGEYKIITGDMGDDFGNGEYAAEGKSWGDDNPDASIIKKFFKIYSIGNVDVWAPPGTALKTNAYFWRRMPQVGNALKKQLYHRLGDVGQLKDDGTVTRDFDSMSATSELTLGYPESIGKYEKVPQSRSVVVNTTENGLPVTKAVSVETPDDYGEDIRYGRKFIQWNAGDNASVEGLVNYTMPRHMLPEFYGKSDDGEEDEGVVAPYTKSYNDALKMISLDQIRTLRNAIEPMYAYVSDMDPSPDYPSFRASYSQREDVSQPIIYKGRRSVIPPVVLACTDCGRDSFQKYKSGDEVYGVVTEYFPSGYTWWFMKQKLGGRLTENLGGKYHMDDGGRDGDGHVDGGPGGEYATGTKTVAKCAISIYGLLPLDKEIVKAYVMISPDSTDPSKNPVGYSWNGGPMMYFHYHATRRKTRPIYDKNGVATGEFTYHGGAQIGEDGTAPHLHGTHKAEGRNEEYYDENGFMSIKNDDGTWGKVNYGYGDEYSYGRGQSGKRPGKKKKEDDMFQDQSSYHLWGGDSRSIEDDRNLYYEDTFWDMMDDVCAVYDTEFYRHVGTPKKTIHAYDEETGGDSSKALGVGYDINSFSRPLGLWMRNMDSLSKNAMKFQYIALDEDSDIVQKYPDSEIWKTKTKEQIENTIKENTVDMEFSVSDGTLDNTVSYIYTESNSTLYNDEIPSKSQEVSGYFDMSWSNSKGYAYGSYNVASNAGSAWDGPVIFQEETPSGGGGYSGDASIQDDQIGTTPRVIDVTEIVQKLYNKRIARTFTCHAGATFEDVRDWDFYETNADGMQLDEDVQKQNRQEVWNDEGMDECNLILLSDDCSYPKLGGNLDIIPGISPDGDKYELAESNVEISVYLSGVTTITSENCYYKIDVTGQANEQIARMSLLNGEGQKTISTYDQFYQCVTEMFPGTQIKKVSAYSVLITHDKKIGIFDTGDNASCYGAFHIETGIYEKTASRVIEVSNYTDGCHPKKLFDMEHPGKWKFDVYSDARQYFVIDLLRAPLCMEQRAWRYEQGYADYSDARCPDEGCKAHSMTARQAADQQGKYFNSSQATCPICGKPLNAKDAQIVPGDGITTYEYDRPFDENPFINAVECKSSESSYTISKKTSGGKVWEQLCSNKAGDEVEVFTSKNWGRGRFIRVDCDSTPYWKFHQYKILSYQGYTEGGGETTDGGYQLILSGDFSDLGAFSFDNLYAVISLSPTEEGGEPGYDDWMNAIRTAEQTPGNHQCSYGSILRIVSCQIIGTKQDKMRMSINRYYPQPGDSVDENNKGYVKFFVRKYRGQIDELRIYGVHFKTESGPDAPLDTDNGGSKYLTITDTYDQFQAFVNTQASTYPLNEPPTQIINVFVGQFDSPCIELTQVFNPSQLVWTTEEIEITETNGNEEKKYKIHQIKAGNYYYDYVNGTIQIPSKNQAGRPWSDFEFGISRTNIKSRMPNTLVMNYWSGNGKTIRLHAVADGNGPSYMVEKNAICRIVDENENDQGGSLEDNGVTCQMVPLSGGQPINNRPIPWTCYNVEPASIPIEKASKSNSAQGQVNYNAGEFRRPVFCGSEIHDKLNDDQAFVDLFGPHCENCIGRCETEMIFTGAPNKIISGEIKVEAPAYAKRTIQLGNGESIVYSERTGGIDQGMLVVKCAPASTGDGRMTKCVGLPKLLIYAKEKSMDNSIDPIEESQA